MTVLERKAIAIRQILDSDDQDFERVEILLKEISTTPPCQYTPDEIKASARKATEAYQNGEPRFISNEDFLARFGKA